MSLKSKPLTPERSAAVERRTKIALAKHARGEPLTETEERIVYWIRYSGGCHACGAPPGLQVAVLGDSEATSGR